MFFFFLKDYYFIRISIMRSKISFNACVRAASEQMENIL